MIIFFIENLQGGIITRTVTTHSRQDDSSVLVEKKCQVNFEKHEWQTYTGWGEKNTHTSTEDVKGPIQSNEDAYATNP